MLCERCKKNNATFFYNETVNGKTTNFSLCRECAKELEKEGKLSFSSHAHDPFPHIGDIDDLFSGFFSAPKKATMPAGEKRCTLCASTFSDIVKNSKVGCAKCYEVFRDELDRTVRSIHGNVKHIPRSSPEEKEKNEKKKRLITLKNELKNAIEKEDFERAAELRDKIKAMEGEL